MKTRKEFEQQIIEKAMKDEDFRKQLMEDPKFILEQETGMKMPGSMNIKVLEEDAGTFYLVLPPIPTVSEAGELSDADLEGVSGGWNDGEGTGMNSCVNVDMPSCYT
jgi:hypothetical protein